MPKQLSLFAWENRSALRPATLSYCRRYYYPYYPSFVRVQCGVQLKGVTQYCTRLKRDGIEGILLGRHSCCPGEGPVNHILHTSHETSAPYIWCGVRLSTLLVEWVHDLRTIWGLSPEASLPLKQTLKVRRRDHDPSKSLFFWQSFVYQTRKKLASILSP